MRRLSVFALPLLAVACQRFLPEPAFDPDQAWALAIYQPKEGDKSVVSFTRVTEAEWKAVAGSVGGSDREVWRSKRTLNEEILRLPEGAARPTRVRRTYDAAVQTEPNGRQVVSRLLGKTVEVDTGGAKPAYTVNGQPPTAEQEKELDGEFAGPLAVEPKPADLLPKHPVKVSETWELNKGEMFSMLPLAKEFVYDWDRSKFTGRLVKVVRRDGAEWATVEVAFKLAIARLRVPQAGDITPDDGCGVYVTCTLEFAADGRRPGLKRDEVTRAKVSARLPNRASVLFDYFDKVTETYTPKG